MEGGAVVGLCVASGLSACSSSNSSNGVRASDGGAPGVPSDSGSSSSGGGDGGQPASGGGAKTIVAGSAHACALRTDGTIACWGLGAYGELGFDPLADAGFSSTTPGAVRALTGASALSAGNDTTCAVLSGGTVSCWGKNTAPAPLLDSSTPTTVTGVSAATTVSTGGDVTCALLTDGTVSCWGVFATGGSLTPAVVSGLSGVKAVAVGEFHACALLSGGTVACWGLNHEGQLGNGTKVDSATPVMVTGLTDATALAVGSHHSCALRTGGAVSCWGLAENGSFGSNATPVAVTGLTNVVAISASASDQGTCALQSDGTVAYWGPPQQAGSQIWVPAAATATKVAHLSGVTSIALGNGFLCAIVNGGALECLGDNSKGQLGNGSTVSTVTPVPVSL